MSFKTPREKGFRLGPNGFFFWDDFSTPGNIGPYINGNVGSKRNIIKYQLPKDLPPLTDPPLPSVPRWEIGSNNNNGSEFVRVFDKLAFVLNQNQPPVQDKTYSDGVYLNFSEAPNRPEFYPSAYAYGNDNFFIWIGDSSSIVDDGMLGPSSFDIDNMLSGDIGDRAIGYLAGTSIRFTESFDGTIGGYKAVYEASFDTGLYDYGAVSFGIGPSFVRLQRRPDDWPDGDVDSSAGFLLQFFGSEYGEDATYSIPNQSGSYTIRFYVVSHRFGNFGLNFTALKASVYNAFGQVVVSSDWFYSSGYTAYSSFTSIARLGSFRLSQIRRYGQMSIVDYVGVQTGAFGLGGRSGVDESGFFARLYQDLDQQLSLSERNFYYSNQTTPGPYSGVYQAGVGAVVSLTPSEMSSINPNNLPIITLTAGVFTSGMQSTGNQLYLPDMFLDTLNESFGAEMKVFWPFLAGLGYAGLSTFRESSDPVYEFTGNPSHSRLKFRKEVQYAVSGFRDLFSPFSLPTGNVGVITSSFAFGAGGVNGKFQVVSIVSIYESPLRELETTCFMTGRKGFQVEHDPTGVLKSFMISFSSPADDSGNAFSLDVNPVFTDLGTRNKFSIRFRDYSFFLPSNFVFFDFTTGAGVFHTDFNVTQTQYPILSGVAAAYGNNNGGGWKVDSL